ncbi:MAG: hypothetical protein FWC27_08230 [Firmicutes bacterium]|nr:hypothetical protein [Bacillota bacterium]
MKTTKRVLGIVLALLLGLALFAPMAMAAESKANLFTQRMPASTMTKSGKTITLAPVAKVPAGVSAAMNYQWYTKDWNDGGGKWVPVKGATGPSLTLSFTVGLSGAGRPYVYKPYYLRAWYNAGGTVVYDNDYTTVGYYMTLSDSFEAANLSTELAGGAQAFLKPLVYPVTIPTWILFGNAVWPATLVSTAASAIGG